MKRGIYFLVVGFFLIFFGGIYYTGFLIQDSSTGGLNVGIDEGIIVIYDEFKGQGETTNFLSLSDSELENISNMVLEVSAYGKIYFNEEINLTQDSIGGTVNIDSGVQINQNNVSVNTTLLTSLDKNALIYIYGLSFSDPVIYREGIECSSNFCQRLSYVSGTLIFNVTNISSYYVIERPTTPSTPETPSTGGGGGGGGETGIIGVGEASFSLSSDLMRVALLQGETTRQNLTITNTGEKDLVLEISLSDSLKGFSFLKNNRVILKAGESKEISFPFFALQDQNPDAYFGIIEIKSGDLIERIYVIIEIREKAPLFDVLVSAPPRIFYGDRITANITIINMGTLQDIDLVLYYAIKDFEGNTLSYKEESLFIKDRLELERELSFPHYSTGTFVYYAKVNYGEITAFGTQTFVVGENIYFMILIAVIILLILIILILLLFYEKRKERKK